MADAQILIFVQRVLYALGTALNRTEFWAFEPGAAPKLLKKLNSGILNG